jgi:hypothetical protein
VSWERGGDRLCEQLRELAVLRGLLAGPNAYGGSDEKHAGQLGGLLHGAYWTSGCVIVEPDADASLGVSRARHSPRGTE